MLSAANENKSTHILRRMMEGWFSVFLFIFAVTFLVRLFLFKTDVVTHHPKIAYSSIKVKSSLLVHQSISTVVQFSKYSLGEKNQVRFGHELTSN